MVLMLKIYKMDISQLDHVQIVNSGPPKSREVKQLSSKTLNSQTQVQIHNLLAGKDMKEKYLKILMDLYQKLPE